MPAPRAYHTVAFSIYAAIPVAREVATVGGEFSLHLRLIHVSNIHLQPDPANKVSVLTLSCSF